MSLDSANGPQVTRACRKTAVVSTRGLHAGRLLIAPLLGYLATHQMVENSALATKTKLNKELLNPARLPTLDLPSQVRAWAVVDSPKAVHMITDLHREGPVILKTKKLKKPMQTTKGKLAHADAMSSSAPGGLGGHLVQDPHTTSTGQASMWVVPCACCALGALLHAGANCASFTCAGGTHPRQP